MKLLYVLIGCLLTIYYFSFLTADLSLAIAYCTQSIISVVNFKGLNFQILGSCTKIPFHRFILWHNLNTLTQLMYRNFYDMKAHAIHKNLSPMKINTHMVILSIARLYT